MTIRSLAPARIAARFAGIFRPPGLAGGTARDRPGSAAAPGRPHGVTTRVRAVSPRGRAGGVRPYD